MSFLKKWFHIHKMEKVASKKCALEDLEILGGAVVGREKTDGYLILSKCSVCGHEKAYLSTGVLTQTYDVLTAKHELGL